MDTVTLTYIGDAGSRSIDYMLENNDTVDKFLSVWQHVTSNKDVFESDIEWHIPAHDADYYTNIIQGICQALTNEHGVQLPDGWQTPPYSTTYLNDLHEGFRVSQNSQDNTAYANLLHDLNLNIHKLEGFLLAEHSGDVNPVIHSFMDFANTYKFDFTEADSMLNDVNYRNRHCIFMAYETLGKTLESVVMDNDLMILENQVLKPKTQIGTQFSVCIPYNTAPENQLTLQAESYSDNIHTWCSANNVLEKFNVDSTHWLHRPGRVILGYADTTQDDWQWFVDQKDVRVQSVVFTTSKFNATISLLLEKTYEINQNISGQ